MEWTILIVLAVAALGDLFFILSSLNKIKQISRKNENKEGEQKEEQKKEKMAEAKKRAKKEEKEKMAEAKKRAKKEEEDRRKAASIWSWWIEHFIVMGIFTITIIIILEKFFPIKYALLIWLTGNIIIDIILLVACYNSISEKEHWTIELLGHWFVTWHPGPHFLLPFFMSISGKVYMGDQLCNLYMDDKERDGEKDALIEFTDASGGVIVRLYYRIFSAHRAVYNIDDVRVAVREKIDAGLRAYLGKKTLDEALTNRASMGLKEIIKQPATGADVFKVWGVEIVTLAMTDIILSPDLIKVRAEIITATKKRDVAEINVQTAKFEGDATKELEKLKGEAIGRKIKYIMNITKLSKEQATSYLLTEDGLNAIKDNKGIFMGMGTGSNPQIGAEFAAGFATASESLKGSLAGQPDETNTKPKKSEVSESETTKPEEQEKGGEK